MQEDWFYVISETGRMWNSKIAHEAKDFEAGYIYPQEKYQQFYQEGSRPTVARNEVELQDSMVRGLQRFKGLKPFTAHELLAAFSYIDAGKTAEAFSDEEKQNPQFIPVDDERWQELAEDLDMAGAVKGGVKPIT